MPRTRDEWKAMLPFIIAFVEGKKVQTRMKNGDWDTKDYMDFTSPPFEYRIILPEPKYVSFTYETAKTTNILLRSVKLKSRDDYQCVITTMDCNGVTIGKEWTTYENLLKDFTFLNGAPCGTLKTN